jgi:hypothetical protein
MGVTLLLDVRVEIASDREGDLNEWYARHVPHLMRTPGYTSGRRYLALEGGPRYAALYEIEHESFLPSLLGEDTERRHELTLVDLPTWDSDLVPHMTHSDFNVWETGGSAHVPVLAGNHPLVQARFDVSGGNDGEAVVRYCDEELLPELAADHDVVAVTRLRPSVHPAVAWIATRPSTFVLAQLAGERAARQLAGGESPLRRLADRPAVSALEISAYRQLLYHAPFGALS